MRDLNLGPDSRKLIDNFNTLEAKRRADDGAAYTENTGNIAACATAMAAMLQRWIEVAWCWPDACPSQICGGPHVKVRYDFDKTVEVMEPANRVGETFPDAKYTVVTTATGLTRRTD
jgi:hypothetical protein